MCNKNWFISNRTKPTPGHKIHHHVTKNALNFGFFKSIKTHGSEISVDIAWGSTIRKGEWKSSLTPFLQGCAVGTGWCQHTSALPDSFCSGLLGISWKGLHKKPWPGPVTHLSWTKTHEQWLPEFMFKKMRIYKVNEGGLGQKCHLLPLQVWKNLLEANCIPQQQSMAEGLQEHDTNPRGCWGCHSTMVTLCDICYHKFQFSKPTHLIFTEWET